MLHKFTVDLPKKHGRGGQSALRFARLRLEKRHNYVRKVRGGGGTLLGSVPGTFRERPWNLPGTFRWSWGTLPGPNVPGTFREQAVVVPERD